MKERNFIAYGGSVPNFIAAGSGLSLAVAAELEFYRRSDAGPKILSYRGGGARSKFYLILAARYSIGTLSPRKRLKFYARTRAEILPPLPRLKFYCFNGGGRISLARQAVEFDRRGKN